MVRELRTGPAARVDEALELWLGLGSVLGRMCSALPHTLMCLKWTRLKDIWYQFQDIQMSKMDEIIIVQNLYQGMGRQKEHC